MKAAIAQRGCNGCGLCTDICPSVFKMTKKIFAKVCMEEVPTSDEPNVLMAKTNCPKSVITLA